MRHGRLVTSMVGILLTATAVATSTGSVAQASPEDGVIAAGVGIDSANRNAQPDELVSPTVRRSWSAQPPLCPSAGNDEARSISVTAEITVVVDAQYRCSFLSAYRNSTGRLLWRHPYDFARRAMISGSVVYVAHAGDEAAGDAVDARDLNSGRLLWSEPFSDPNRLYPINVGAGIVTGGFFARRSDTGALAWAFDNDPDIKTYAVAAIADDRVYINSANFAAVDAASGRKLWVTPKPYGRSAPGTGAGPLSVHQGRVYAAGPAGTLVMDQLTGRVLRTLPPSLAPIAFHDGVGIFTGASSAFSNPVSVQAVDLSSGRVLWTYRYPPSAAGPHRQLAGPPLITKGLVWLQEAIDTGTPTRLTALDETSGRVRAVISQPCAPVDAPWAQLVAGRGRLFTPTRCGLVTYSLGLRTSRPTPLSDPIRPRPRDR